MWQWERSTVIRKVPRFITSPTILISEWSLSFPAVDKANAGITPFYKSRPKPSHLFKTSSIKRLENFEVKKKFVLPWKCVFTMISFVPTAVWVARTTVVYAAWPVCRSARHGGLGEVVLGCPGTERHEALDGNIQGMCWTVTSVSLFFGWLSVVTITQQ